MSLIYLQRVQFWLHRFNLVERVSIFNRQVWLFYVNHSSSHPLRIRQFQGLSNGTKQGMFLYIDFFIENTVDEKITSLLESKQAIFDAFADQSVAAKESLELDDKKFGDIIKEEIERI